jgi:hypothetical protein
MKQITTLITCMALIFGIAVWGGPKALVISNGMTVLPEPYAQSGVNPFVGKWVNSDSQTFSFTKLAIWIDNGAMIVEAWASCSPEDCYWGRVAAHIPRCETERIEATWVLPIVNEFQEIIYVPQDDYLIVRSKSFYTYDQSGRCESQTLYFIRGDFPMPQ